MNSSDDEGFMRRCIRRGMQACDEGELPIGALIASGSRILAEAANSVRASGRLTAHAEIIAIEAAQGRAGSRFLSGATLYTSLEPCPMCAFLIREAGITRVVYALTSPVMGGLSHWDVLRDKGLSEALPEVFGPVPEVVSGLLASEAERAWRQCHPLIWATMEHRGCISKGAEGQGCEVMAGEPERHHLLRTLGRLSGML